MYYMGLINEDQLRYLPFPFVAMAMSQRDNPTKTFASSPNENGRLRVISFRYACLSIALNAETNTTAQCS